MRVAVTLEQCWHRVPGGTAVAAIETVRALRARGDVDLVGVAARHLRPPVAAFTPQVAVRQLPLQRNVLYESWHRFRWPPVERATGAVDVIHATGVAMPPRSVPVVVTVHDLAWRHYPQSFTRNGLRFFAAALDAALDHADLVLCSSEATRADALAAGFAAERLTVVPLGVRAEPASADAVAAARARHGLLRRYVLAASTLEPRKNLPTLVEAVRRLERHDLDLVLVGPAGWQTDEATLVAPLGDRVTVTGFVPAAERDALMAGAAVFCYPSLLEGFGLPVLEAMAQGAPVVTSLGTATAEVAGDAAVLVDPHDPAAVAEGLAQVLDDAALAARLADGGRARAARFTWARSAEATVAAYRRVLVA